MGRKRSSTANIVVGPVIGKVTANSARILVEVDRDTRVECTLLGDGDKRHSQSIEFEKGRPLAIVFKDLHEDTTYDVEVAAGDATETGKFATFRADCSDLRCCAVACDKTSARGRVNMWERLLETYLRPLEVDLVVHHGDQVYADDAFKEGVKILQQHGDKDDKHVDQMLVEEYQKIYRATWGQPEVREALSHASHLMLWDDHEVRNDWGTFKQDKDKNSRDYRIATAARTAYWLYQRQLWDAVDDIEDMKDTVDMECHVHAFGSTGVMFVDSRGGRSFYHNPDDENLFLSDAQFDYLRESLEHGELSEVKALLVVQSIPLCLMSTSASSCLSCIPPQVDKMGFGLHKEEQARFLDMIADWKGSNREVLVVGGDLHYGVQTEIRKNNRVVFTQIVSSAISNKPPPPLAYYFIRPFLSFKKKISGGYTFKHTQIKKDWNFAVIDVNASNKKPKVTSSLIFASTPKEQFHKF